MNREIPTFISDKRRRQLEFGPVLVISGKYTGKTGVYDDDKNDDLAIVYLEPKDPLNYFESEYVLINKKSLINVAGLPTGAVH